MHFDAERFVELGPAERLAALRALAGAGPRAPVIPSTNCPRWLATIADDMTRGLRVHVEHVPVWMDVGPDGLEMGRCRMVVGQRVCVGYSGLGEDEQAAFRWALSQTADVILMGHSRYLYVDGVPYRFRKDWPAPDRPALKALGLLSALPEAPEAPADRKSAGADGVPAQPGEGVEPQRHRGAEESRSRAGSRKGAEGRKGGNMKLYVASSWRNERYPEIVTALREAGHEVYDFRNPGKGDIGFQWSEIDPNWQQWTCREYVAGLSAPPAERGFRKDWKALTWAEGCVLVLPCGRSAHLEAGVAIGHGKPLFILLADMEPELMYKMATGITDDLSELLSLIENSGRRSSVPLCLCGEQGDKS